MTLSKWAIIWVGLALFAALAAFNSFYGYSPTDDGFVLGFAWRVWNGEIPHRDFITIRPPLPVLLHQVWFFLPENLQFIASRIGFYFWMGLLWMVAAVRLLPLFFRERPQGWIVGVSLLTLFWIYTVHNFPPMPWHTIDGVVLSSLSLWLLVECADRRETGRSAKRWGLLGLSAALAGFAPYTKQSFLVFPIIHMISVLLMLTKNRKGCFTILLIEAMGLSVGSIAILGYLAHHHALPDFLRQYLSASNPGTFMSIAVHPYIRVNRGKIIALALGLIAGWGFTRSKPKNILLWATLPALYVLFKVGVNIAPAIYFTSVPIFFFFISWVFFCLFDSLKKEFLPSHWILGVGSLSIGWMASISIGYSFPILGSTGLGLFLIQQMAYRLPHPPALSPLKRMAWIAAPVMMLIFVFTLQCRFPYRDEPRDTMTQDVSKIFQKLGPHLKAGPINAEQLLSAKTLSERFRTQYPDRPLIVFPEFPLFYFLTNTRSAFPLDWWISMDYPTYESQLIQQLELKKPIVLFQLSKSTSKSCSEGVYGNDPISQWILKNSVTLDRQGSYCVQKVL